MYVSGVFCQVPLTAYIEPYGNGIRDSFTLQHYNHHLFPETLWSTVLTQYCLLVCSKSNNAICNLELSMSISNNQMIVNNKFK